MKKPSKIRKPIPGVAIVGLSITFIVLVLTIVVAWFLYPILFHDDIDNRRRGQLEAKIAVLPVPPTCHERERKYQRSGSDAQSTWTVLYNCDTTGAAAHDAILAQLKAQEFKVLDDHSAPYPGQRGVFYDFSLMKEHIALSYTFRPSTTIDMEKQSIEELHSSKVAEIYVSLTLQ